MSFRRAWPVAAVCLLAFAVGATAHATLPEWMQHVVGASSVETAMFRAMSLPGIQALYPRPPREAQTELAKLIATAPERSQLYGLRARSDEAALDFAAAETDWKEYVQHSEDATEAKLELADYYQRRLMIPQELVQLSEVAAAPAVESERFVNPAQQRSWRVYERELALSADQGLPATQTAATFQAFVSRYPEQPAVYAQFLTWQLAEKDWAGADATISRYRKAFPKDDVFAIRAQALLEYRRGNVDRALAVYEQGFQPLWPAELVQSYFRLLDATHRQRAFVAEARVRLAAHPDGPEALNALARIFYYDQQAGRLDKAQQTIDSFRVAREARNGAWTPADLYTLAALTKATHSYAESARYNYALASMPGNAPNGEPAAQAGLSELVDLLLTAPDQPIALGAGNLTLYRDIATLDQGPGYWNGILSLWLNGTSPANEYNTETAKAQSYFHRAKAAELLAELDAKFPAAAERAGLHAEMIRADAGYGESAEVIVAGKQFLASFPASPARVEIAGLIADAYARDKNTAAEFALYDSLLTELAAKTGGLPLTAGTSVTPEAEVAQPYPERLVNPDAEAPAEADAEQATHAAAAMKAASYELTSYTPASATIPEASEYSGLLDRYIGRLVAEKQVPQALMVLRHELELYPNDPLLYERLASFLQQNNLSQQQEEIYKLAIAKFQEPGWFDKLARLYLRERNRGQYTALTHQVTDIFAGTELDAWFAKAGSLNGFNTPTQRGLGPQLAVQLNLYAQKRFPHDLVFTRNLLNAYDSPVTRNAAAYDDLLRHHWWESDSLRNEFFAYLARTGKLQDELTKLQPIAAGSSASPAATRELSEIDIWNSHFEQAAPLMGSVAALYPAEATTGERAVSLYRSLAYLDATPHSTAKAVAVEKNLIAADPLNADRLGTLGDLSAEATATGGGDVVTAAPAWRRMPALHPGTPAGYLSSATIFWDYFQFDDALAELKAARERFHQPTLYGYEAGAIAENRHDLATAVAEYAAVAMHPPDQTYFVDSLNAALGAFGKPPSDAADSNLRSTAQSLFNAADARARLLRLATRPASSALVDNVTAQAVAGAPAPVALALRADVLIAQHRQAELGPLLDAALARATTMDQAAAIGDLARSHSSGDTGGEGMLRVVSITPEAAMTRVDRAYAANGPYALTAVYEHALAREIALSSDPVQKIELSYTLSGSLESHKDDAGAAKIVDGVYRANPRILGVVRATTDFYARTKQPPRAIATLLEAAKVATPDLARGFTLEAANRANEAGDTAQAKRLAEGLLQQTPYDAAVLGVIATSYARANDDAGLKAFYVAELAQVKAASLTTEERKADTALLRRGLIPALTRTKDDAGALDQYIALISAYPDDASTAQEAALYAIRYHREDQLLAFLRTTVRQSPRDSRFAILLAQVETTFDDLPAAVAAYGRAVAIRKDRADIYEARVDLELRLGLSDAAQNDAAEEDLNRLYVLSYKDPTWMVRLAELRARQQRPADAVKALETAYVTGQTASPTNQFRVADQLAQWNFLAEAQGFVERGLTLAGADLLTAANGAGAASYARVTTRLGNPDQALARLAAAYSATARDMPLPPQMVAQYARAGVSASDIARDTKSFNDNRRQIAHQQLEQAVTAIGQTVATYYTPEQKLTYAKNLDALHQRNAALALEAATAAGLSDREAEWRKQLLLNANFNPRSPPDDSAYVLLERRRLAFGELAQTLEAFAARVAPSARTAILQQTAQAYRDAGDETNELRVTRPLVLAQDAGLRDRFLDLLLRHDRAALAALAGSKDETLADAAANYAVAHATQTQALSAIGARARTLPAVWGPATGSLVATNFASASSTSASAMLPFFAQSLRYDDTIATRLAHHADANQQLTGDVWFYNASRFGLFLATVPKAATMPAADDFLSAELEQAPSAPAAYLHLARNYADEGDYAASAFQYLHAMELAPNNPTVHDESAVVLDRAGRHNEALTQWRAALLLLANHQTGEEFFTAFKSVLFHLGQRSLTRDFRPEVEAVLKPYFGRNGNYRSNELLEAIYKASSTPVEGTSLVLAGVTFGADPNMLLDDLRSAAWVTPESREAILLRQIQLSSAKPQDAQGQSGQILHRYQTDLVELYLNRNELAKAQAMLDEIPADANIYKVTDEIVLAVRTGHLQALLDTWRVNPDKAPDDGVIRSAIADLSRTTSKYTPRPAALAPLQEFVFTRKQLSHSLAPTDFLALAQSRIASNDLPGALDLLHRLTLQPAGRRVDGSFSFGESSNAEVVDVRFDPSYRSGGGVSIVDHPDPTVNTSYAASLLEATHHDAEAVPFLAALVQSVPWNSEYRLRLGEAELKSGDTGRASPLLTAVAKDATATYEQRVLAARNLGSTQSIAAQDSGSGELSLLASGSRLTPTAARQTYFAVAREAAADRAATTKMDRIALLRESIAMSPNGTTADHARLELLLTQTATESASATLAIYDSLSNGQLNGNVTAPEGVLDESADVKDGPPEDPADGDSGGNAPGPTSFSIAPANALDRPTQIRLAVLLASAYMREHNPAQSLSFDQLAVNIDAKNLKPDPVVVQRLRDYEAALLLEQKNALRRPLIHAAQDQVNQVRPRLTVADQARAEAP